MKKIICFILGLGLILSLCGCSAKEAIASHKQEYIVTALGFDTDEKGIRMILEAVVVNSDDLDSSKENRLIEGAGANVDEAFSQISQKTTQPLMFSHTGTVIISDGLSQTQTEDIYDFCYERDEINLAVMFVNTENAKELLSCKTVSSVGVGFDIMSLIEVVAEEKGMAFENLFYEIESARNKPQKTVYLPVISVENKEFFFDGTAVLKENRLIEKLNTENSQILYMIKGDFDGGSFLSHGSFCEIKSIKTTYDFDFEDRLLITVNMRLDKNKNEIKASAEKLIFQMQENGEDVFGFGNEISHKSPDIWKKIGSDYEKKFKNALVRVEIYE